MRPSFLFPARAAFLTLFLLTCSWHLSAQAPTAAEILGKSIAYHDPQSVWGRFDGSFSILMETPDKPDRLSYIRLDQPRSHFGIRIVQDGVETELELRRGDCTLRYNGSETFSEEVASTYRLTCERARMWRDYYTYLYGLPMKLHDPGAHLDPRVERKEFHGKSYWVLRVTYDPETGSDTWYFYFDPQTFALEAYQFFHDEAKNDGEYILLEGEAMAGSMRLPKKRSWYTNKEHRFLGTDILQEAN